MNDRILIIDDNEDLVDSISELVKLEGFTVRTAYSGRAAIDLLRTDTFDLVLLDQKLPDISGIELFQQIHNIIPNARVFLMTGYRVEQIIIDITTQEFVEVVTSLSPFANVLQVLQQVKSGEILLAVDYGDGYGEELRRKFIESGLSAVCCSNADDVLEVPKEGGIEIVVLDLNMPILCGLTAYLTLQKSGCSVKVIIVLREKNSKDITKTLHSIGSTGCIFKPFIPSEVIRVLKGMC